LPPLLTERRKYGSDTNELGVRRHKKTQAFGGNKDEKGASLRFGKCLPLWGEGEKTQGQANGTPAAIYVGGVVGMGKGENCTTELRRRGGKTKRSWKHTLGLGLPL